MRRPLPLVLVAVTAAAIGISMLVGCPGTSSSLSSGTLFNLPPTVVVTAIPDPPRGVAPLAVQFDSSNSTDDGVIVDRNWDFGDGTTSKDISPLHTFQTNGTFTVQLTLTDDAGATSTRKLTVLVTERPIAIIKVDKDSAANAPATFQFDGSTSYDPDAATGDVLQYRWDFGDGAREVLATLPHTYTAAGTYRVVLTVTDATGIVGTDDMIVTVGIPQPTVSFRIPPSTVKNIVCSTDSPLWVMTDFSVESGVPYTLTAGLRDQTTNADVQLGTRTADRVVLYRDLDLSQPTPLDLALNLPPDLAPVAEGTYKLWVELTTDRTTPTRLYATANVHVVAPFTSTISTDTPSLPAVSEDQWSVVLEPSRTRQIFRFGSVTRGDRLFLSLLTTPAYSQAYDYDGGVENGGFSLLILDAQQDLYAWYDSSRVLFTPNSKLMITRAPSDYYVIVDSTGANPVPSVNLSVTRAFEANTAPRQQTVYLNFAGASGIAVAGSPQFDIDPFTLDPASDAVLMEQTTVKLETLLAPYDFVVLSSSRGDAEPGVAHKTIYFDATPIGGIHLSPPPDGLVFYGAANFLDPRSATLSGRAVVDVRELVQSVFAPGDSTAVKAGILGNVAAHELGFMCGLRATLGTYNTVPVDDVMTADETEVRNLSLGYTLADLAPLDANHDAIGHQDAPELFTELFGAHP
jgi:PKD repeat protein